jgi:hypothetical protein
MGREPRLRSNIHVVDLNAPTPPLAAMKWNKRTVFYRDLEEGALQRLHDRGNDIVKDDQSGGPDA